MVSPASPRRWHLEFWLEVAAPRIEVFHLLADPRNLNGLTPHWFDLVPATEVPNQLTTGVAIDYLLRWRAVPLRWTSVITEWSRGERVTYEQGHGPYEFFRHEHRFEDCPRGTRVTDHVSFVAPGGWAVRRLIVAPDLRRIFRYRNAAIVRLFDRAGPGH